MSIETTLGKKEMSAEEISAMILVKMKETAEAYNKVGKTAHIKGNLRKAKQVMNFIGYSD